MSRGRVHGNMSGRGHRGSAWWPVLPQGLRGAVKVGGKVVDGRERSWSADAQRQVQQRAVRSRAAIANHAFRARRGR